jgi:hypothetical protein
LAIITYWGDPEKTKKFRVTKAAIITTLFFITNIILVVIIKFMLGGSKVNYEFSKVAFNNAKLSSDITTTFGTISSSGTGFYIQLGYFNALTIFLALIGSFAWCCVGGFGLANAPIVMINSYLNKPSYRDAEDYTFTR